MKGIVTTALVIFGIVLMGQSPLNASNIEAGKAFFGKKRCGFCHMIEGKGGKMAIDLSKLGSQRDREWLMKFFENPKKVANAKMPPVMGSAEELSALADYLMSQK